MLDRITFLCATERATSFPWQVLPIVYIITPGPYTPDSHLLHESFQARLETIKYHRHFSTVRILRLDRVDPLNCREFLRQTTISELQMFRKVKESAKVRFSGRRLADLFSHAVTHFSHTASEPFNYLRASRIHRPVPTTFNGQRLALMKLRAREGVPLPAVRDLISSCLLLDAYPKSCHGQILPPLLKSENEFG